MPSRAATMFSAFPHSDHPTRAGISPILPGAAHAATGDDLLWRASAPRFNLHFLAHGPTPMAAMERAAVNRARHDNLPDGYTTVRRPHSIGHPRDRPQVGGGSGLVDWKKAVGLAQRATMGAI